MFGKKPTDYLVKLREDLEIKLYNLQVESRNQELYDFSNDRTIRDVYSDIYVIRGLIFDVNKELRIRGKFQDWM